MIRRDWDRYDGRTIWLHWLTAGLFVFMWVGAHTIDWFPKGGALRGHARSLHIVVGTALAGLLAYRVYWRRHGGAVIPQPPTTAVALARAGHVALYVLLFATLALGLFNTWVRGDDLFGLGRIPAYGDMAPAARQALKHRVAEWHPLGANLVLILAGLHALVALAHRYILHDGVLQRMISSARDAA